MREANVLPDGAKEIAILLAASSNAHVPLEDIDTVVAHFEANGVQRNTKICGALMQVYRNSEVLSTDVRLQRGDALLTWMRHAGVPRDVEVYNPLLSACSAALEFRKAHGVFRAMIDDEVVPSGRTFSIMVNMCSEENNMEKGREYHELRESMRLVLGVPAGSGSPWDVDDAENW